MVGVGKAPPGGVDLQNRSVFVQDGDVRRKRIERREQELLILSQLPFVGFALRDVANHADGVPLSVQHHGGHRNLDGKAAAVFVQRFQLQKLADYRAFARLAKVRPALFVALAVFIRNESLVQTLAQHLIAGITEGSFRSEVPVEHASVRIEQDDRIQRRLR